MSDRTDLCRGKTVNDFGGYGYCMAPYGHDGDCQASLSWALQQWQARVHALEARLEDANAPLRAKVEDAVDRQFRTPLVAEEEPRYRNPAELLIVGSVQALAGLGRMLAPTNRRDVFRSKVRAVFDKHGVDLVSAELGRLKGDHVWYVTVCDATRTVRTCSFAFERKGDGIDHVYSDDVRDRLITAVLGAVKTRNDVLADELDSDDKGTR